MNSALLYRADPLHAELGDDFLDVVEAATFPRLELRYRNHRWAERVGLGALDEDEWLRAWWRGVSSVAVARTPNPEAWK